MPIPSAAEIAQQLTPMLLPLIPYFMEGLKKTMGDTLIKKLAEKGGEQAVKLAEKIWEKLKPRLTTTPAAQEAIESIAQEQDNPHNKARLRESLEAALEDTELRKSIIKLIHQGEARGISLESYIEAGNVYGEVRGILIKNARALKGGRARSTIKANDVGQGGVISGVIIEEEQDEG